MPAEVDMTPAQKLAKNKPTRPSTLARVRKVLWRCELRGARLELQLTIDEVSSATGVSVAAISQIERGTDPTLDNAQKLADFFGASIEELWPERIKEFRR